MRNICGKCRYYRGAEAYPEVLGECEYLGLIVPYDQEACPEFKPKRETAKYRDSGLDNE